ncbi:MAG: hypothetical protein QM820_32725 [Minicystis sp.]
MRGAIAAVAIAMVGGCVQLLGIEGWEDPPGTGGGSASSSTGATTTSTGGAGGAATSSSSTSSSSTASSSSSSGSTITSGGAGGGTATCFDGLQNGPETDVDCGSDCPACAAGRHCSGGADCQSGTCIFDGPVGVCAAEGGPSPCQPGPDPTCNDCLQNGGESDVDCGGDSCLPCSAGRTCTYDGDCLSAHCAAGTCTLGDSGKPCRVGADCTSGACGFGSCITGSCCQ